AGNRAQARCRNKRRHGRREERDGVLRSQGAFHDREVDKVYHAVVEGRLDPLEGTIDAPIGRHPGSKWKFAVVSDGKRAVSHYETLEAFPHGSLVEVRIETGRTHQIRVHL